jgi:ATP-binding cassette, subfamily B (MDR/TAP), member 7
MVTAGTVGTYVAWTLGVTSWRTGFRKQMNAADNEASTRVIDSLINYETVKYFGTEKYEAKRYDSSLQKYEDHATNVFSSLSLLNFGQSAIFTCGVTGIMLLAANGVSSGTMTIGDIVMVNGLLFQVAVPLNFLGTVYREMKQSLIDMGALFSVLHIQPAFLPGTPTQPMRLPANGAPPSIEFRDVHFGYQDKDILRGLSFHIEPGKTLGIVGSSGSGKSTVMRLLNRFYDHGQGLILVNGQDIRDIHPVELREQIGVVPQDTVRHPDGACVGSIR